MLFETIAMLQLGIAVLNLFLVPLLKWKDELARVPLLLREVFQVHAWFISITITIFGIITCRFADELATGSNLLGRWLAVSIGLFWLIRTVLQVSYYSGSHWRGQVGRTVVHVGCLLLYGGFATVYLCGGLAT
jgi:hypothetical protein